MNPFSRAVALALLAVAINHFAWGLSPGMTLLVAASSDALLNERPALPSSPVRVGDSIRTTASGSAELTANSAHISLGHLTVLQRENGRLRLLRGLAHVSGRLSLSLGSYSATPVGSSSDFEAVALLDGQCFLHVSTGVVRLVGQSRSFELAPGTAVTWFTQDSSPDQQPPPSATQAGNQQSTTTTTTRTEVIPPLEGSGARPAATVPLAVAIAATSAAAVAAGLVAYCLTTGKAPATMDGSQAVY
jgi:hypothetical protein